tara:strand:+ start:1505 stop:2044 length:540 start_codon:yes stop_codon:yes gene_type:complete
LNKNNNNNVFSFRVAQKAFKAKNMLNIESNIEASKKTPEMNYYSFLEDVIFLKLAQGIESNGRFTYDTDKQEILQMNSSDLRSIMYACKKLYKTGTTNFKKFSEPGLRYNTNSSKKILSLAFQTDTYFINIKNGNFESSFTFDKYKFLSFIDSLAIICDETERVLYNYQRKNDYKMKTT